MAATVTSAPTYVVVAASDRPGFYENYASRTSFVLGAVQICSGLLVTVVPWATLGHFGYLFFGILFVSAGACGVAAGKVKKSCQIIGSMVVSIIAAFLAVLLFIILLTKFATSDYYWDERVQTVDAILVVFFLIESIASIWSAAVCCRSVCCGRRVKSGVPVQYQVQSGQVVMGMVNAAQPPQQQQQPTVPYMVPPPYPGQGAAAPTENAAYEHELPPKY